MNHVKCSCVLKTLTSLRCQLNCAWLWVCAPLLCFGLFVFQISDISNNKTSTWAKVEGYQSGLRHRWSFYWPTAPPPGQNRPNQQFGEAFWAWVYSDNWNIIKIREVTLAPFIKCVFMLWSIYAGLCWLICVSPLTNTCSYAFNKWHKALLIYYRQMQIARHILH